MKAYWMSGDSGLAQHALQGAQGAAEVGLTHTFKGDLKVMSSGLHWAEKLITAIRFAGGPVLWDVEVDGNMLIVGPDVSNPANLDPNSMYTRWGCAESRQYLKRTDFLPLLLDAVEHLVDAGVGESSHLLDAKFSLGGARRYVRKGQRNNAWEYGRSALWSCLTAGDFPGLCTHVDGICIPTRDGNWQRIEQQLVNALAKA